jgi:hypothetical protein
VAALETVVLVEGISDQRAVESLARRRGRDLEAEGVTVVAMGGAHAIRAFLERYGPQGLDARLAGLCDAGEERDFARALERAGLGSDLTREDMERLGFFVCVADLEDEVIRALGPERVEHVIATLGYHGSLQTFQKQPAWRGRPIEDQLWRFLRSGSNRYHRIAPALVDALDLDRLPRPLDRLLAHTRA